MSRVRISLCLLSLMILIPVSMSWGADQAQKPTRERAVVPARFGPVYGYPIFEKQGETANHDQTPVLKNLRGSFRTSNPDTVGETPYDYQHNCTMGRQVEHRAMFYAPPDNLYGEYVHFDWMAQDGFVFGQGRGIGYQAFEIATCDHVFNQGGLRVEGNYAGYVAIDADPGGWAILAAHEDDGSIYPSKAYWDFTFAGPAYGVFSSDYSEDAYGWVTNNGAGPYNENSWPKIAWDIDGMGDPVLHMVATEYVSGAGDPQSVSYYRRVGPYGVDNGVWSPQRLIDTVMCINVTVAASPVSDRVVIAWNAPTDYVRDQHEEFDRQYMNDIWFAVSTQNGADWANDTVSSALGFPSIGHTVDQGNGVPALPGVGGNITLYDFGDTYKAYSDMSSLITTEDNFNVVWNCIQWDDSTSLYRRNGGIFHWQEGDPLPSPGRAVVIADWDTGGSCFAQDWAIDACKMTISECDGKLYTMYSQFGSPDNPCGDVDSDNNITNGYLYMSVFDPIYGAWDRPQRVTTTPQTPNGCTPGDDCNSECWGSMARYGRVDTCLFDNEPVLDVIFINDKAPGGSFDNVPSAWTMNPVIWWTYACREAVPEPGYRDDAGEGFGIGYDDEVVAVAPGESTELIFTIENDGIIDNALIVDIVSLNPDITVSANFATLDLEPQTSIFCTLTVAATVGAADPSTGDATVTITHDAEGSPRIIPLNILVSSTYVPLQDGILATTCKRLRVYNNGQLSNNAANASLDFMLPEDPDDCGTLYLYDGSPIICRDVGGEMRCFFAMHDNSFSSPHALQQVTPLVIDSLSYPDYTYAMSEFITADTTIGLIAEYYAPKDVPNCGYIIQRLRFWNMTEVTLTGVGVGEALDWDVPSYEDNATNESGSDASRNLVYQLCCDHDPCDSTYYCRRYGGIAAYHDTPFKNYMTLENDVYIYTSGPFGDEAPFEPDTTYGLMSGVNGYLIADTDTCEDLTSMVTFGIYDLEPADTQCVVKILTTSTQDPGGGDIKTNVDLANDFVDAHPDLDCEFGPGVCDCVPGDANGDGAVNVGDAVYVISYVFKGGPAPTPYVACSGDAQGDCACNVGDAVYIISYVFKGGPPPVSCDQWRINCGDTIY